MADNSLKDSWKSTGVSLGHSFRDLGKSLIKTGKTAIRKTDQWANSDDNKNDQAPTQAEAKPEETKPE